MGYSLINQPFWGSPILGNPHIPLFDLPWLVGKISPIQAAQAELPFLKGFEAGRRCCWNILGGWMMTLT